jgi:hypothetical protein
VCRYDKVPELGSTSSGTAPPPSSSAGTSPRARTAQSGSPSAQPSLKSLKGRRPTDQRQPPIHGAGRRHIYRRRGVYLSWVDFGFACPWYPTVVLSDNGKRFTGRFRAAAAGDGGAVRPVLPRTASLTASPAYARPPPRGGSSGSTSPCGSSCPTTIRCSPTGPPRRRRSTLGGTTTTPPDRTSRWAWPPRRAGSNQRRRTGCRCDCPPVLSRSPREPPRRDPERPTSGRIRSVMGYVELA